MTRTPQMLEDIKNSPKGPGVAAIFDFDGTLIAGYSATVFIREQLKRGDLSPRDFVELMTAMASFGLGRMGFSALMLASAQLLRGISEQTYREMAQQLYRDRIARLIYPESRALVDAHMARGHTVAIISSATPYQVEPAAADLGIDHVMCSHFEVENGSFTGQVIRPTCFGQGKVTAAEKLAVETGVNLDKSFFYSDSFDDIELLERVGKPRVLNPNTKLFQTARERHWPIARFGSRGRPSVAQFIRSVAATGSLVSSFAAGLPIYALTRSRQDAVNFSMSLFADTASALIGLDLDVTGEDNLWSHRPAVFVFNHQSKADVVIIARLLRRDIASVGKKEIKNLPVIGQIMEFSGVVMIDRKNASNAIEAMAPLVDVMQEDGKSVVMAPEGTRTVSPRLERFKKGAFHLAMQAGVPIVPIVIRNALDVAPKGDFVFRPAVVDVEVLPPVDTSDWSPDTIDEHVREVRNLFLKTLGQPLEKPASKAKRSAVTDAAATGKSSTTGKNKKPKKNSRTKSKTKPKPKPKTKSTAKAKTDPKSAKQLTRKTRSKAKNKTKTRTKRESKSRSSSESNPPGETALNKTRNRTTTARTSKPPPKSDTSETRQARTKSASAKTRAQAGVASNQETTSSTNTHPGVKSGGTSRAEPNMSGGQSSRSQNTASNSQSRANTESGNRTTATSSSSNYRNQ